MKTPRLFRLTPAEARAHAILLAVMGWSIVALSLAGGGVRSRFGPLKWADFVHFYTLGHIARTGPSEALYDEAAQHAVQRSVVPDSVDETFRIAYPPLVALMFAPLSRLPYLLAGGVWAAISVALLLGVVTMVRRRLKHATDRTMVYVCALGFPPTWELIAYGQTTAIVTLSFALAWLALGGRHRFLAGLAFGGLMIKPQFGLAIAVAAVACAEWRLIAGACVSIMAQLLLSAALFGQRTVMMYAGTMIDVARTATDAEGKPYMQHSLRVLAEIVPVPFGTAVLVAASAAVIYVVVRSWSLTDDHSARMGILVLGSVLINPHLYVYDASVLVLPALWLGDLFAEDSGWFWRRCYVLTLLLLVPVAALIRVQLSVLALLELLYESYRRLPADVNGRTATVVVRSTE